MRNTRKHPFLVAILAFAFLFALASCGSDDDSGGSGVTTGGDTENGGDAAGDDGDATGTYQNLASLEGQRIGVQSDTTGQAYAEENAPEGAEIVAFDDTIGLFGALESGDIVAILQDIPVNADRATQDDTVVVVETFPTGEQYGFAVAKDSDLKAELDGALEEVRGDGTYDALYEKYFPVDGAEPGPGPDESDIDGSRTLTVCSDIPYPPMEMEGEGPRGLAYTGFDIELLDAMAASIDANLEILAVGFDGILGNLASGTCDVVASSVTITDERAEEVDFTEPYFDADQSLLVKKG